MNKCRFSLSGIIFSTCLLILCSSDRPIVEGKRQRTAVKAFTSATPVKEKKSLEFEVGQGTLLGQIDIGKGAILCILLIIFY